MNGISFGLIVEGSVAILLLLTIFYCVILNNRLKKLHADRDVLRQMVSDLVQATNLANSAIKGLREAASDAEVTLGTRLNEADRFAIELANHVSAGQTVMDRIVRVTDTARRSQVPAAPPPVPAAFAEPVVAPRIPVAPSMPVALSMPVAPSMPAVPSAAASSATTGAQAALDRLAAHQRRRESAA